MPITATDIVTRLTTKSGTAGDTTASTPAGSLGGFTSTTVMGAGLNALFDDISGSENSASTIDYRAFDVLNNHATLSFQNAIIYLSSEVVGGAGIAITIDNVGPVAKSATAQGANVATEVTAPTGVGSFSSPVTSGTGLALGTLAPGQVRRVWVKRTAANTGAVDSDGVTFTIIGDTSA